MVGLVQRKLNPSLLRACIRSADDGRLDREACVRVMTIQLFPRIMLVGSRCTFIGMLGGVENFVVNVNSVTNGAWVGVETDGVVVVGKIGSSLSVLMDGNDAMLIVTCWL